MPGYYDRQGQPIGLAEMAAHYDDSAYRIVGRETLADGRLVSTVWIGIDHQFGEGPPLIFETMVFPPNSLDEICCRRYATETEAREGHARILAECKTGQHLPPTRGDA